MAIEGLGIGDAPSPLVIDLTSIRDGVRIVVSGEIDLATAPQLQASMTEAVSAHRSVEVDLTDVDFIDSTGLRAFISARAVLGPGHAFAIAAASPCVLRLLETVGLEEHFGLRAKY